MIPNVKTAAGMVVVALLGGCSNTKEDLAQPTVRESTFIGKYYLTAQEVGALESRAKGDVEAALRLSRYYSMIRLDEDSQIRYLLLAETNGSREAARSLAAVYGASSKNFNLERANYFRARFRDKGGILEPDADWYYSLYLQHKFGWKDERRGEKLLETAASLGSKKAAEELKSRSTR